MISVSLSVKLTGIVTDGAGGGVVVWILATGFWDDDANWLDDQNWVD